MFLREIMRRPSRVSIGWAVKDSPRSGLYGPVQALRLMFFSPMLRASSSVHVTPSSLPRRRNAIGSRLSRGFSPSQRSLAVAQS